MDIFMQTGVYADGVKELFMKIIYSGKFYVPEIIPSLCTKLFKEKNVQFSNECTK